MNENVAEQEAFKVEKTTNKIGLRKTFFLFSYLSIIPVFIIFISLYLLSVKYQTAGYIARQEHKPKYQALPGDVQIADVNLEVHDGREDALNKFFASYNSPLEGFAGKIIEEADRHNIDYRLLPAIAMQESTLCKKIIKNSYNCWGFGIYGNKVTKFRDYNHAIEVITKTIAEKYVQQGLISPEEIATKYTPSDTGKWSEVVSLIMTRLKNSI